MHSNMKQTDEMKRRDSESNLEDAHLAQDGWTRTLRLAFQSIGVMYGDIGTSPLYVFSSTFSERIEDVEDVLGVLSMIIYTLILIPMVKYVFIVLQANDHGNGGTFALYSLLCRHAKAGLIPNQQMEDEMISNYRLQTPSRNMKTAEKIKEKLEKSNAAKISLFLTTILATSMVLGDGILTPCISVLSAVSGIKSQTSLDQGAVVGISIAILIVLFSVQQLGTEKVGYAFAPVILIWFTLIGGIGLYNLFKYNVTVLQALNPKYILDYFKRNGRKGWISLGGVVLCVSGAEAMFADLGHFNLKAVQISSTTVLFPSVSIAYIGQAAYLTKYPENVSDTFYKSIPNALYWPTLVVSVAAAIIASQSLITGVFSIISQSLTLGCFPRVKVLHTSTKHEGQVYIPGINYMLMVGCITVTATFKTTENIGNAYGITVVSVMLITTILVSIVMLIIWKTSIWRICLFMVIFGGIELVYISSSLYKFKEGGFLPLIMALFLTIVMAIWHYMQREKYLFELKNNVSESYLNDVTLNPDVRRIPGIGLLCSDLEQGIPPIFPHFIQNLPSIHSVFIFVTVKHLPVSRVSMEDRFLFKQIGTRNQRMFRCVVRCGYTDSLRNPNSFEAQLVEHLKKFIDRELSTNGEEDRLSTSRIDSSFPPEPDSHQMEISQNYNNKDCIIEEEKQFIQTAMEDAVVYLLGEFEVAAAKNSNLIKKIVVDHLYDFLRRNFKHGTELLPVPQRSILRIGMTYEI